MADKSFDRPHEPLADSSILRDQPPINGVAITMPLPQRRGSSKRPARSDLPDHTSIIPPAPEVPHTVPISYRNSYSSAPPRRSDENRSFSARAKDLPTERGLEGLDQYVANESPQRTNSQQLAKIKRSSGSTHTRTESRPSVPRLSSADSRSSRRIAEAPSLSQPGEPISPVSPSSTLRTPPREDRQQREWAPDRSPLQKLEVTLNDISKEEKRARVEEAEMLLREAKAGRRSRRVSHDVTPTPTSRDPRKRESNSAVPSNLEEAGLVRSLSSKQRDRLQHSAVLESTRPDPRQFSTEGRITFDYEERQSITPKSLDKVKFPARPGRAQSKSKQPAVLTSNDVVGQSTSRDASDAARPQERRESSNSYAIGDSDNVEQQVKSSRRAPLAAEVSVRPPGVERSDSRKLQKPLPRDPNTRLLVSHRELQRVTRNQSQHGRSLSMDDVPPAQILPRIQKNATGILGAPSGATVGLGLTNAFGDQPQPTVPASEQLPIAPNVQGKSKQHTVSFDVPPPTPPPLEEWRNAKIARLCAADFDLRETDAHEAWWESGGSGKRRRSKGIPKDDDQPQVMSKSKLLFQLPCLSISYTIIVVELRYMIHLQYALLSPPWMPQG